MNVIVKVRSFVQGVRSEPVAAALLSLASDSALYLVGGILIGLCNVVLVPLYTRTLGVREFGVYALIDITILMLVSVTMLKLDISYLKWFAEVPAAKQPELLGTTLVAGLLTSTVSSLVLFLFLRSTLAEGFLHQSVHAFAWIVVPIVVLENFQGLALADFRARRDPLRYSSTAIIRLIVTMGFSYYLLAVRQQGLPGLFVGRLAGDVAAFIFVSAFSIRKITVRVSPGLIRPMIRFGLPLVWSIWAVMLQDAAGRYFLTRYGSLEEVGYLGAAVKIGAVFQMLVANPFGIAWGGVLFQLAKAARAQIIFSTIFNYVCVATLGIALILSLFRTALLHIFAPPSFYPAITILPIVFLVRSMSVIEQPASTGIYLSGRTDLLSTSYTVALGVNLVLLRVLVPHYGLLGAAMAWLCGSMVVPALFLWFGHSRYRLNFRFRVLAPPVLLWILILVTNANLRIEASGHHTLYLTMLSVFICGVLGVTVAYDFHRLSEQIRVSTLIPSLEVSSR